MAEFNPIGIDPKNYLKLASVVDRNGTKETSFILDTSTNNFYLVDDDGNVTNINGWQTMSLDIIDSDILLDAYINYLDTNDPSDLKQEFISQSGFDINARSEANNFIDDGSNITTLALNGLVRLPKTETVTIPSSVNYGKLFVENDNEIQKNINTKSLFTEDNYVYRENLIEDVNPRYVHKVYTTSADGGYALSIKIDWDDTVTVDWSFSYSNDIPA